MQGEPTTTLKSPLLIVNKLVPHSENNQTPTGLKPWKNLNPFLYKIWTLFLFKTLGMRLWIWPLEQTPVWWLKPIPSLILEWSYTAHMVLSIGFRVAVNAPSRFASCDDLFSPFMASEGSRERNGPPCVSSRAISCNSPRINGELACRLCLVNCDSKWCKAPKALCIVVYKFVACAPMPHMLIAQRGRNSSCEYFYRTLGCPQLTLSSCDAGCVAQWSRISFHL